MIHAITRLEEELRVIQDVRRQLYSDPELTPALRNSYLGQTDKERREISAALRLIKKHLPADQGIALL